MISPLQKRTTASTEVADLIKESPDSL